MPRKPGTPKTGGRQPGTPNKRNAALRERLAEAMGPDWCPVVEMARIAADPETDRTLRVACLKAVAPYCQAQLRSVDTTHHGATLETLVIQSGAGGGL